MKRYFNIRSTFSVLQLLCFFLIIVDTDAQNTRFNKSYGNRTYNEGVAAFQLIDTTFLVVGNSSGFNNNTAPYIFRIDQNGDIIYDVMISRAWLLSITAAVISNEKLYLSGYALKAGNYQVAFMITDFFGNVELEQYYNFTGWSFARDITITGNDQVFICGEKVDTVYGEPDALLISVDTAGQLLWHKTYGGTGADVFYSIDTGHTQTLIMAGKSNSFSPNGEMDFFITNTDLNGDTLWQSIINDSEHDIVYDIHPNIFGGYYLCGKTAQWAGFGLESYIMHIDNNGNRQYITQLGGEDDACFYSIIHLPDNTFRMAGYYSGSFSSGGKDMVMQNADQYGVWDPNASSIIIGGHFDDIAYNIIQTFDKGFLLTGTTKSFGTGLTNILLIKLDSNGIHASYDDHQINVESIKTVDEQPSFKIYPNPAINEIYIEVLNDYIPPIIDLLITDISGRVLKSKKRTVHNDNNKYLIKLPLCGLSSGIYIVRINNESHKLIVRKEH